MTTTKSKRDFFLPGSSGLVELDRAVELGQLFFEQLEVGVDEAQLQGHGLLHLLVRRRSENKERKVVVMKCDLGHYLHKQHCCLAPRIY